VAVRPVFKPALRRVWRDASTLQIGVHHARSVVVGGITAKTAQLVAAFDGAHDADALRRTARQLGLEASTVDRLLGMLVDAAVLDDAASDAYFASRPRESQLGAWASQQSRELESREVLLEAGAVRFKPILLTALAAMIGAATILLDPIFQGLAISLLFGLASSTLLTVLVIPALYVALRDADRVIGEPAIHSNEQR